jgi:peroxiredoxin Q/BCP
MAESVRLIPGMIAPDFTLKDQNNNSVHLVDYRGKKVILYFYPKAGTPGCTAQACDFRDSLNSLQSSGYQVLGVSADTPAQQKKFEDHKNLTFPLLSDHNMAVHRAYGTFPQKLIGPKSLGILRSTFVIDEKGIVTMADYTVKPFGHVARLRSNLGIDG